MLKRLLQYILLFFTKPETDHEKHVRVHTEALAVIEEPKESKAIEFNMSTGGIKFPDDLTSEEKAELESAMQELHQHFGGEDLFQSFEAFLKENSENGGLQSANIWDELTKANNVENAQAKIAEEMEFCEDQTEHWSDGDFIEALLSYENQGYEFEGIEDIYKKVFEKLDLTEEDSKKIRNWYKLVSQELVYES